MSDVRHPSPYSSVDVAVLEPMHWRSWPLVKSPARAAGVVAGIVAAAVLAWAAVGSVVPALLAAAALTVSLWRFFTPVTFALSEQGVEQWAFGRRLRIPWRAIRGYEECSAGVLLVPHGERAVMVPFRSLYLPWENRRDEVLAFVRHHLDPSPEMSRC